MRVATYNTELARDGPGLLLRDILRGDDVQIEAVLDVIVQADADILALQGIDFDLTGAALTALLARLPADFTGYPYHFAQRPNTGWPTGLDMDGNGRLGERRDAQGYGAFSGQGGMAVISRYPIDQEAVQDFSALLWRDLPGARLPETADGPFPSAAALEVQRLSTTAHWVVPINTPQGRINILTYHATPPVFDGPEDRNGRRNADETRFWQLYLDGRVGPTVPGAFVILGDANLDAEAGDGSRAIMADLLADPRLNDPRPEGAMGTDTVDWRSSDIGTMRVDYVLPARSLTIVNSGVLWPPEKDPFADTAANASRHRLVWVDIAR